MPLILTPTMNPTIPEEVHRETKWCPTQLKETGTRAAGFLTIQISPSICRRCCKWQKPQSPTEKSAKWRILFLKPVNERLRSGWSAGCFCPVTGGERSLLHTSRGCFSLLFYIKAPGCSSTRPHQTLQPPCLDILLADTQREKNPILHRVPPHFSSSFQISSETWLEQNILWESGGGMQPCIPAWPCFLNYLSLAAALKGASSGAVCPWKQNSNKPRLPLTALLSLMLCWFAL